MGGGSIVKLGKCKVLCGYKRKRTANLRESSRIAFFLRRRALLRLMRANRRFACRLKWAKPIWASPAQESHAVWKNAVGKTGVPVFLKMILLLLILREFYSDTIVGGKKHIFSNGDMGKHGYNCGKPGDSLC